MPSTGMPRSNTAPSHFGAPSSDTLLGPPDRISPTGFFSRRLASGVLNGTISEYTDNSRNRRAMSCVYCEPKSRTRMVWCDTVECLAEALRAKAYLPRPIDGRGIIPQHIVAHALPKYVLLLCLLLGACPPAARAHPV